MPLLVNESAYCVFIGSIKFASFLFESVSERHITNSPRLLGQYGENFGHPGLGSRERAVSSHSVNEVYLLKSG